MKKTLLQQFKSAFETASGPRPFQKGALTLRKTGETWNLLGRFTNPYRDTDFHSNPLNGGDIITDDAHKEFEKWLDARPQHALELWSYHQWGTARKSRANWWAYTGTAFYANWPLTEEEAKAISEWAMNNEPGMSFGFYVFKSNWEEGLIEKYRAFEASILPLSRAANPWTTFMLTSKENNMFDAEKRKMLVAIHGEALVADLEKDEAALKATLDAAGVERKEAAEGEAEVVAVAPAAEVVATVEPETQVAGYATEEGVVEALKRLETAFSAPIANLTKMVEDLSAKVKVLEGSVDVVAATQAADSKAQAAPLSVLRSYMPTSILAQPKDATTLKSPAEIDGRSTLAKSMPAGSQQRLLGLRSQDLKGQ